VGACVVVVVVVVELTISVADLILDIHSVVHEVFPLALAPIENVLTRLDFGVKL
jgi:hypothetical protein